MKRIFAILIAMVSICGCLNEKDYAENAIVPSLIVGTWYESYDIYPDLAWDIDIEYCDIRIVSSTMLKCHEPRKFCLTFGVHGIQVELIRFSRYSCFKV